MSHNTQNETSQANLVQFNYNVMMMALDELNQRLDELVAMSEPVDLSTGDTIFQGSIHGYELVFRRSEQVSSN